MNELEKLQYLSLVSKVCTELENHLGFNDKDMAEFIIDLAEENSTFDSFKSALIANQAQFTDSFIANLLRIIQHMRPKKKSKVFNDNDDQNDDVDDDGNDGRKKDDKQMKRALYPCLALPDREIDQKYGDEVEKENHQDMDDTMKLLEQLSEKNKQNDDDDNDKRQKEKDRDDSDRKRSSRRSDSRKRDDRDRDRRSRSRERRHQRDYRHESDDYESEKHRS